MRLQRLAGEIDARTSYRASRLLCAEEGDVAVAGYTSIVASVWLVGGMLLFSLGVVGLAWALVSLLALNAGSLAQDGWQSVEQLAPRLLLVLGLALALARPLRLLELGDQGARSFGLAPGLLRGPDSSAGPVATPTQPDPEWTEFPIPPQPTAQPSLTVNTFHGWFLQLVVAAPLSVNLAGMALTESDSRRFDELWQSFAEGLGSQPNGEVTQAFVGLLDEAGLDATRRLMRRAYERRSEWLALEESEGNSPADGVVEALRNRLGVGEPGEALARFFATGWDGDVQSYLGLLEMSELKSDQQHVAEIGRAHV